MATFAFFRLHRELRNGIYAEIGGLDIRFKISHRVKASAQNVTAQGGIEEKTCNAAILSAPKRDTMVICHKSKVETEAEISRFATLRLQGVSNQAQAMNSTAFQW